MTHPTPDPASAPARREEWETTRLAVARLRRDLAAGAGPELPPGRELAARKVRRRPDGRHNSLPDPDEAPARSAPRMTGHWPIRLPDLDTLRRSVALTTLKEALTALGAVNEGLTGDVSSGLSPKPGTATVVVLASAVRCGTAPDRRTADRPPGQPVWVNSSTGTAGDR